MELVMPEVVFGPDESQSAVHTLVLMTITMRDELYRRASADDDEGVSPSRLTRRALREYFRRHPHVQPKIGGAPNGSAKQKVFVYLSASIYGEVRRHMRHGGYGSGRLIRAALEEFFARHPE